MPQDLYLLLYEIAETGEERHSSPVAPIAVQVSIASIRHANSRRC